MSVRVESRGPSSVEPMVSGMAPPEPKVAAAKVGKTEADLVEEFRATENDARAGFLGRTLEQFFHGVLSDIPEGGEKELELSAEGGEEGVGQASLKATMEHRDGQYLVTVQGAAALGVGGLAKGAEATATGGLTGTATFRFGSAKEAADAMAALVQAAPETGIGGPGAKVLAHFVRDEDTLPRAFHAAGRLQSVEVAGKISGQIGASIPVGEHPVAIEGDVNWTPNDVKLDLAKGELVVSTSIDAGLNGTMTRSLPGILTASSEIGALKGSVSLEQHFPLSLQDIERIQRMGLPALKEIALDSARQSRTEAAFELEGNAGGLAFKAERRGNPAEIIEAIQGADVLRGKDWSFRGVQVGKEVRADLDAGPLKLKASVKDRQTVIAAKGELGPLVQQGTSRLEEATRQERRVEVLRAQARGY